MDEVNKLKHDGRRYGDTGVKCERFYQFIEIIIGISAGILYQPMMQPPNIRTSGSISSFVQVDVPSKGGPCKLSLSLIRNQRVLLLTNMRPSYNCIEEEEDEIINFVYQAGGAHNLQASTKINEAPSRRIVSQSFLAELSAFNEQYE